MEVVESIKEGYESDVLEPEMSMSSVEDKQKSTNISDEDKGNDSDEDFNIDNYVSDTREFLGTTESSSIRYIFHSI